MNKEKVKTKNNVTTSQKQYPKNHRIRPDDMTISEAALEGLKLLEATQNLMT